MVRPLLVAHKLDDAVSESELGEHRDGCQCGQRWCALPGRVVATSRCDFHLIQAQQTHPALLATFQSTHQSTIAHHRRRWVCSCALMVVGADVGLDQVVAGCSVDMVPGALALLLAKPA